MICSICRREMEAYFSNPCPNCNDAVKQFGYYVECAVDLDWAALKSAVVRHLAEHEEEVREQLGRHVERARRQAEELREKRIALERQAS